jgi:hypothetical protein
VTFLKLDAGALPTRREIGIAGLCFVALSALLTYPQIAFLDSKVGTHYDALFSIWRIAWIAHQLLTDPAHLFDTNIFYPEPNTLALSDAILLPALLGAPFIWAGASPTLVYNCLVLLSFASAGLAMYFFVRCLGASRAAGAVAGIFFAFQPYRFAHYPQIELLWTCWIPLAFWALHRAIATSRPRDGALLGMFVAFQALSCLYYAVFLVTVLPILALLLVAGRRLTLHTLWKPAASAIAAAAVLTVPYAWPYAQLSQATGERTLSEARQWSPTLANYLISQHGHWVYPPPPINVNLFEGVLFPGALVLVLALVGLLGRAHRLALAYTVVGLIAFDISLGTNGFLFPQLFEIGFPYAGLRVSARMFVIVSAALAVLAAIGVAVIERRSRTIVSVILVALALVDVAATPIPLDDMPDIPRAYTWLAKQPHGAVFEWPVPRVTGLGGTQAPRFMYFSARHWKPLVIGYSGHYPESYLELLERIRIYFPREDAIRYLRYRGVKYLIVHGAPIVPQDDYRRVVDRLVQIPDLELQFALRGTGALAVFVVRDNGETSTR